MYYIFYFLILILVILFFLLQFFNILSQRNDKIYKTYFNLLIFLIVLSTLIGVIINIYMITKNHNKAGIIGNRGIIGAQGNSGKDGICDVKCGQKVCYLNVVEHANKKFKEITNGNYTIKNKAFLKLLNTICNSDEYFATLTKRHKNKPTEIKLINYIKEIVSKWIIIIILGTGNKDTTIDTSNPKNIKNDGIFFLTSKNLKLDYINQYSKAVFDEIKKYDIYRWGNNTINLKRKQYFIESSSLEHPSPDESRLYIMKTNNYTPVYSAKKKTDVWDATHCPYNQLGIKLDNPNNLEKCIYINQNTFTKTYHNTWKTNEYFKPQELSLYNVVPFKNKHGIIFYPVGSVWRGKNDISKPKNSVNLPESSTFCGDGHGKDNKLQHTNKGPEKETILVSGDIKEPINYRLIWNSKLKCSECQINHVQIFRPIPPKDYVALGDVAVKYNSKYKSLNKDTTDELNKLLQIRCVPKECLRELKLGNRVWNNKDFYYNKYSNYLNYTSKVAYHSNRQIGVSLWDAGNSNSGEEIRNNYGVELEENGGYNLFRTSDNYSIKPKFSSYIIKQKYLMFGNGKAPAKIEFNLGKIKDKISPSNSDIYKTDHYFGEKPDMAILTNIKHDKSKPIYNNANKPKKFYLIDDGSKRDSDTKPPKKDKYFIKTFNEEKNNYSSCLTYPEINSKSPNTIVLREPSNICSKNSLYNRWVVQSADADATTGATGTSVNVIIRPIGDQEASTDTTYTDYKLVSRYDEYGKTINELIKDKSFDNPNWRYDTPVSSYLPKYNIP